MSYFSSKYTNRRFLIQQEDSHNKFWTVKIDPNTHDVTITWGRLGTKGQSQVKRFSTDYAAGSFASNKFSEKQRKGYREVTEAAYEKLVIEASIVGTANKCGLLKWVEFSGGAYREIPDDRLMSPDCDPKLLVELETRKGYDGEHCFSLLFSAENVKDLGSGEVITKSHPLYELTGKVEEAVGRQLSA